MRDRWLVFAALAPPVAWALRLVIAYPLVPVACQQGSVALLVLVSVAALALCLAGGVGGVFWLRRPQRPERGRFMARGAVALSVLFGFIIVAESIPMLFSDPCLDVDLEPRRTRWSLFTALQVPAAQAHKLTWVPEPAEAWRLWSFEPGVVVALAFGAAVWLRGARAVWRRRPPAGRRREALAFSLGFGALVVALISPIDTVSGLLFWVHMVQHLLLVLVAAPLLALARPGVMARAALPPGLRRRLGHWWRGRVWLRSAAGWMSKPVPVVTLHLGAVWVWHVPIFYDAALEFPPLHALEHASFLATAWLFWSLILRCARGREGGPGVGLLALFATMMGMGLLSALLALAPSPMYFPHAAGSPSWSITPMEDQQLAGLLMWVPGGAVYLVAAVRLAWALLAEKEVVR